MQYAITRILRWDLIFEGHAEALTKCLIVNEEEGFVFLDRAAHRAAVLVAMEWRYARAVKEISCVEYSRSQKSIGIAVKTVRSRSRDRVDDSATSLSIFRVVV